MKKMFSVAIWLLAIVFLDFAQCSAQTRKDGIDIIKQYDELRVKAQSKNDLENVLKKYGEALRIFDRLKAYKDKSYTLTRIGSVHDSLGQYAKAVQCYEESMAISSKIGDIKGEGVTLNEISLVFRSLGQFAKAQECAEKSLSISRQIGDLMLEAASLNNLGLINQSMGQTLKSLEYYDKSLAISHKTASLKGQSAALSAMGSAYSSLGEYAKALENYDKSLSISQKIGNVKAEASTLCSIGSVYFYLGQYEKALGCYDKSLAICEKLGDVRVEGMAISGIGSVYGASGEFTKALDYFEKSLSIKRMSGDLGGEAITLNNMAFTYQKMGQYAKSLKYYQKSLSISREIGEVSNQVAVLTNIGRLYSSVGDFAKALEYHQESLAISVRTGDRRIEGACLRNSGATYMQLGSFDQALNSFQSALTIHRKIGLPTHELNGLIGGLYLDKGELAKSESFIKESGIEEFLGRLYLLKSDYFNAKACYERLLATAEKSLNADSMFTSYTGLGKVHEELEDYSKSEEYYQKGMALTEEIRSSLLPSERNNFFEVRINGFYRSDPSKGLTRVRMKLNQASQSIDSSEATRARAFSDHISRRHDGTYSGMPREILEKEDSLITKVASLKKELLKTDKDKQPERHSNIQKEISSAESDLKVFIDLLWDKYKPYAAVKFPRPVTLKQSLLKPEELAVIFDVSTEGVGVKLIKDKKIAETHYVNWKSEDLEKEIKRFRECFEGLKLREFDCSLGNMLYKRLLSAVLSQVPKGSPIIIVPDGILATLPFEALVTGGTPTWKKVDSGLNDTLNDYPEGLTFFGDEHPVSYYQSITALTLARNAEARNKQTQEILVLADPVFDLRDKRVQSTGQSNLPEQEKKTNTDLMQTIEDAGQGTFKLTRLAQTSELAHNLQKMYGTNCSILTGLKANKSDFLSKVAPTLDQYSGIIFATHGVMSTHIPGLMEPFLALTMAPPGTDGFLKMSDVLGLKMNADVVALTACQTGLGKELSGEGVMSMGRAFQYAGAKSVLMSLWSVSESASVLLTEKFFQHLKDGKNKLEALKAARDDIRNAGYKHPFFWSAFILVGEKE